MFDRVLKLIKNKPIARIKRNVLTHRLGEINKKSRLSGCLPVSGITANEQAKITVLVNLLSISPSNSNIF